MRVGVLGAGSIGCYIGACLIRAGVDVVLAGRPRLRDDVARHGLHVSDTDGLSFHLPAERVRVAVDAAALADRDLVLVCVKSADTAAAARALDALPSSPRVVSFQNGIGNAAMLRQLLPRAKVIAGMVPWNVVWKDGAHFHRGTSGALMIEAGADAEAIASMLDSAGLRTLQRRDLAAVLWGKLLLNLNNPLNALSGLPLRAELATRGYRRVLAALMREALAVMRSAGVRPARAAALPPGCIPWVLDLPDALFVRVAGAMLKIDPEARSSMWEDFQRGRTTEIDYINGEIVRLAERAGVDAPLNRAVVELVHRVEAARDVPAMTPAALASALSLS